MPSTTPIRSLKHLKNVELWVKNQAFIFFLLHELSKPFDNKTAQAFINTLKIYLYCTYFKRMGATTVSIPQKISEIPEKNRFEIPGYFGMVNFEIFF